MTTDIEALRALFERAHLNEFCEPVQSKWYAKKGYYKDEHCYDFTDEMFRMFRAGHAAGMDGSPIIGFVADIRAAAGDPLGKLDWDELVTHIAGLHAAKAETAAAVAAERNRCADLLQRKAEALESLPATALAFSMMADAIRAGAKEPSDG